MLDLRGPELLPGERELLLHPLVGGVILFSRNYQTPEQLSALVGAIHELRQPRLLVAVDHEGGAVQRFRSGFTSLPACTVLGRIFGTNRRRGLRLARECGWLMAAELRAVGVDFSFAPVLDLGTGVSRVVDDRAFHRDPKVITQLAHAYIRGMQQAGMSAVGKHFPGHGSVAADSHHEVPIDQRPYQNIRSHDMAPFEQLIRRGLPAIMPAHVIYLQVDDRPAGFSSVWLRRILRQGLKFQGAIFSDDISMAGAVVMGDFVARARCTLEAGCDMVLVCNNTDGAAQVLDKLGDYHEPISQVRLMRMHGRPGPIFAELAREEHWQRASREIRILGQELELDLGDDELA
jgi:beta-N-acetylhexosaminidase